MATKLKASAYRLTGGSKTEYSAEYEEKVSLFQNFKKQTEKLISHTSNLVTDNLATELKQKITKDNVDSGLNKYEKVGQAIYKYSSQIEDNASVAVLQKAKEVFEKAGQQHRAYRSSMIEKVQKPLKDWTETNAKNVNRELKTLSNKRDELDCAINKLRKNADDPESQAKKDEAENAHKDQFESVDKLLDNEIKEIQSVISGAMIKLLDVNDDYNRSMRKIFKEGAKS